MRKVWSNFICTGLPLKIFQQMKIIFICKTQYSLCGKLHVGRIGQYAHKFMGLLQDGSMVRTSMSYMNWNLSTGFGQVSTKPHRNCSGHFQYCWALVACWNQYGTIWSGLLHTFNSGLRLSEYYFKGPFFLLPTKKRKKKKRKNLMWGLRLVCLWPG